MAGSRPLRNDAHPTFVWYPLSFPPPNTTSADILVDVDGALLRVQVKSTRKPKNHDPRTRATPGYFFHLRRAGKGGRRRYPENAFDLYALVALDRQAIAYLPAVDCSNQTIALRVPGERYLQNGSMNREFQEASFRHALSRLGFEA